MLFILYILRICRWARDLKVFKYFFILNLLSKLELFFTDYEMSSPLKSYIHIDEFSSAKELAEYLHILDKNDELYNSYFKWKSTGEFINTYFWYVAWLFFENSSIFDWL